MDQGNKPDLQRCFRGHQSPILCTSFTSTTRHLVCGSNDGQVVCYNFAPSMRATRLTGHTVGNSGQNYLRIPLSIISQDVSLPQSFLYSCLHHAGSRLWSGYMQKHTSDSIWIRRQHCAHVGSFSVRPSLILRFAPFP